LIGLLAGVVLLMSSLSLAQETTGGLQGTVKDSSGAVLSNAHVEVRGSALLGVKGLDTDTGGYYRFANLPPGTYTITVSAKGFKTIKREGVALEVGHLPTIDITLDIGATSEVVEVTGAAPLIDLTTQTTQTNVTSDVIQDVPHGRSFQSVIQFAPSASNEPLMGTNRTAGAGTGGSTPGGGANGNTYGFSVAGGSDSENSYLVEGQETANLIGGYSHTNVPFDFIQEVQVKSSGIEAEHGGALGGVVNVVMKKGGNSYHGSVFSAFENQALDGSPTQYQRYDPLGGVSGFTDATNQIVQPIKPKTSDIFPGFTFGGPLVKDKAYFFVGFNPEFNHFEQWINYGPTNGGNTPFSQNTQTYYTTARIDYAVTQKLRLYGSWLYQYQRQSGEIQPYQDSTQGFFNFETGCFGPATSATNPCVSNGVPQSSFAHSLGFSAPNTTTNVGADWTLTPRLISTTRFGYYFENYHDFGFPTGGNLYIWGTNGLPGNAGATDALGNPLPASLQQSTNYNNVAFNPNFTSYNASKAVQFDQDFAFFKSGWGGTHNFKFGYQLNRLSNTIFQHYNDALTNMFVGTSSPYSPATQAGIDACAPFVALYGQCQGLYGWAQIYDYGSKGKATSYNHGFFIQDAWTTGHGITINAGLRLEREYLPGEATGAGAPAKPINFGWGDKLAPRIGAAWDVFKDGRMKVFGSYGRFYDVMKLNVAISSFGGQYWQNCAYALDTSDLSQVNPVFGADGRYCEGVNGQANFPGGVTPAGLTFLENQNLRAWPTTCSTCSAAQEGVAPGLKPYQQHESVFGVDYQISKGLAFEARWDRRRLDHAIEDSSIFDSSTGSETFVIVNPGQGLNSTFLGFCDFIYGAGAATACAPSATGPGLLPPNKTIPSARSYDGLELRLVKATSHHWFGMFSYTYSHFRGNYTGLTSSDISDGGVGGRNAPNNSRSFDEPFFSWNADGGSSSGLLPTDRPNKFKGYAYYEFGWLKKFTTNVGLFQYMYQGSPTTTFADVGYSFAPNFFGNGGWPVDVVNRGKWVDLAQDPTTGEITVGSPRTFRTPWYMQSDFNLQQNYKLSETKVISFSATFQNLFNQHSVTAYNAQVDSGAAQQFLVPGGTFIANGVDFYAAAMAPFNLSQNLNNSSTGGPLALSSQYGQPLYYQNSRTIRLQLKFTF
jgi:hypothetical protein